METISIFPYSAEDQATVLKEAQLTPSAVAESVEAVYDWYLKQPHLADCGVGRDVIEKMLIITKGSQEKVKRRIDNFMKYRGLAPDLIQSRIPLLNGNGDIWSCFRQTLSTKLFDGRRITVIKFVDPNPSAFFIEDLFRNGFMIGDMRLKYDYTSGEIWLIDFKNISFGHLLRLNPMVLQRAVHIFQEGLGFRVYAINILNPPVVGEQLLHFFKRYVKPKIMERLNVHSSLEDLHRVLPKRYLPADYGGDDPSMDELQKTYETVMRSERIKKYLLDSCKQVSDEKKRPASENNPEFLAGSFKQLEVD